MVEHKEIIHKKLQSASTMSWLSKKTGRPKEEDGHRRINVSVDKLTDEILQIPENRSKYIEYCIKAATFSRRIRFREPEVTVHDEGNIFKTAAVFHWTALSSDDNAIISIACYFRFRCEGEGFRFRISINGNATSAINVAPNGNWTWSNVYKDTDFASREMLPNQSSYLIEFQFALQASSGVLHVKDINMILDVIDGLPSPSR